MMKRFTDSQVKERMARYLQKVGKIALLFAFLIGGAIGGIAEGSQWEKSVLLKAASQAEAPWPLAQHDAQTTGQSSYLGPQEYLLQWNFKTQPASPITLVSAPVIGADGTIYIGSNMGMGPWQMEFYALNPDGTVKWSYVGVDLGMATFPRAGLGADGTVYVTGGRVLFALNSDGKLIWSFELDEPNPDFSINSTPTIAGDGTIFFVAGDSHSVLDGTLYAIHPNGTLKWKYFLGNFVGSAPAISNDGTTIYVASSTGWLHTGEGKLHAVNAETGIVQWILSTIKGMPYSPTVGPDGTIYQGTVSGMLFAINSDKTVKWVYQANGSITTSAAIGLNGTIYVGSSDNSLYAIRTDGTLRWRFTAFDWIGSDPVVGIDGTVYVSDFARQFYAIDDAGNLKWQAPIYSSHSPAIGNNGTLYVPSSNSLYAIGQSLKVIPAVISPADKTVIATTQNMDIVFYIVTEEEILDVKLFLDGRDITEDIKPRLILGRLSFLPGWTLRYQMTAGTLSVGAHIVSMRVQTNTNVGSDAVTYFVVENTEP